jgi:23S rRNA (uracil1939-C5)-methyltransferase
MGQRAVVTVRIEKLVNGGQGLGQLEDGRKVFVWNALPGETVTVRIIKQKRSYAEAIAEEVLESSPEREAPREANYLATSPWQIMTFAAEHIYKQQIVEELFQHEKVTLPVIPAVIHDEQQWAYRNKMEYSFWGDDTGLHLALHQRGSHGKQIVTGSALAMPAVDQAANAVLDELQKLAIRAGDLKTIIVRSSQPKHSAASNPAVTGNKKSHTVAALFVKTETFPQLSLPAALNGLRIYYSNPKSPASVPTKLLHETGDTTLRDTIIGTELNYDPIGFFQANVPVFERAVSRIDYFTSGMPKVDFYSGVGAIGLPIGMTKLLVETDPASATMARQNAAPREVEVIEATAEQATGYITADNSLIVDPPRAGLHARVIDRIFEVRPPAIAYLSCNPATHARDLAKLQESYDIKNFEIYNFFPRTPHIECLAFLVSKSK